MSDGNRIAVLLPDLRPGGAERMRVQMAREWLARGLNVDFVLRQAKGELLKELPSGARVVDLQAPRVRNAIGPLIRYLKKETPDALLAAMWPLTVITPLAARMAGYSGRVVVSEHNNMTAAYKGRGRLHALAMAGSMRLGYPLTDAVVGVSGGVVDNLSHLTRRPSERFNVIHNPAATGVDASKTARPEALVGRRSVIVSVGTLKRQKRQDLLIEAFALVANQREASLFILGEGAERPRLEAQVARLGLQDRVFLVGHVSDPAPWYAAADLFVLASDYEGFGNVIVEALEQGVPVVSTDCPSGPREILEDGTYGTLVPVGDTEALARAMEDALSRPHDHEALKRRARDFSVDKAADAYLELLLPDKAQAPPRAAIDGNGAS